MNITQNPKDMPIGTVAVSGIDGEKWTKTDKGWSCASDGWIVNDMTVKGNMPFEKLTFEVSPCAF